MTSEPLDPDRLRPPFEATERDDEDPDRSRFGFWYGLNENESVERDR